MTLGNFPVLIIGVLIHKWVLITFPHRITERISDRHTYILSAENAGRGPRWLLPPGGEGPAAYRKNTGCRDPGDRGSFKFRNNRSRV